MIFDGIKNESKSMTLTPMNKEVYDENPYLSCTSFCSFIFQMHF